MGRFTCGVTINRPAEEVFAVLTDAARTPEWSKHAIRGELLTAGPPRVGSRRRSVVKGFAGIGTMESVFEITEIDPPRAVALRIVSASWGGGGGTRYTFTPLDEATTRVDWSWDINPVGPMKLAFAGPMLAMTRRMFQADLENLKTLMESRRITASPHTATESDVHGGGSRGRGG